MTPATPERLRERRREREARHYRRLMLDREIAFQKRINEMIGAAHTKDLAEIIPTRDYQP